MARPIPANAIVASSTAMMASPAEGCGRQPSASATPTRIDDLDDLDGDDRDDLRREQHRPAEWRGTEPFQDAIAAFERGGDPEADHRRGHDREREHAGSEEVHPVRGARRQHRNEGEEHEEHDGYAERDEQRLPSLEGHAGLGTDLCPQRPGAHARLRPLRPRLGASRARRRSDGGTGQPEEDVLEPLPSGPEVAEREVPLRQPGRERGDESGRRRGGDEVLAGRAFA